MTDPKQVKRDTEADEREAPARDEVLEEGAQDAYEQAPVFELARDAAEDRGEGPSAGDSMTKTGGTEAAEAGERDEDRGDR